MTISHHQKFIFIHVHRTGGSTINNLLKQELGNQVTILAEHVNISASEEMILEMLGEYHVFSFVRNPWDRMLSWYSLIFLWDTPLNNIELEQQRFETFLELDQAFQRGDEFFHYNQLDYFPIGKGALNQMKLFRYEDFQKELKALFHILALPLNHIPIINNTTSKNYKDYYTTKSIELIRQKCKKDIEYFNYSF